MKKVRNLLLVLLAAVLCLLLLTGCGEKEEPVNITLANHSGHGITSISITPSTSDEWDTELVDGIFQSGEMMEVSLGSYKPSELPDFNILVYNEESYVLYDNDVDEVDFTIHDGDYVVFLSPDGDDSIVVCTSEEYDNLYAGDGENAPTGYTAEELGQTGGMSGFSGCWKLENAPFYFVINDNYEWIAVNLYGEQVGPGYVVDEGENITLCMEDDSQLVSLWQTAYGALSDANGNTLTAMDYIMLLPTPEDDLNQTAAFPGGFTNVTIDYPIQMEAHEQPNVSNALSFNAVMEDGTDDYYSNIMIAFQPIEGFDPYMEKGAATAKTYMVKMLDDFMKSMYGSYLIKSFGSDFKDNGDYYSLTGYMWLDGDIFSDGPSQPVRGCMEVRYYGPTGYALVATTIALEGRIHNYFEICNNMLETISYTAGWSTAREIKFAAGYTRPGPRDYVGPAPLTAPESLAMYGFTRALDPQLTLSYHTQGRVIYWQYDGYDVPGSKAIAERFAAASGYAVAETPYAAGHAGYKDWFLQDFRRPGFTIEAGSGENPLPLSQFPDIWSDNLGILLGGMAAVL